MLKVTVLDDYQNISQEFIDLKKLSGKYEIKVFSESFEDEKVAQLLNENKIIKSKYIYYCIFFNPITFYHFWFTYRSNNNISFLTNIFNILSS